MKSFFEPARVFAAFATFLATVPGMADDWGRELPTDRDDVPGFTLGLMSDVQATVISGPASVSDEDLSIGDSGLAIGYKHEYWGWLCSLRVDFLLTSMSEDETAHSDLYIKAADDVEFNGGNYRYMRIPEGGSFKNEFTGGWLDLNGMFHPKVFGGAGNTVTPLLEAGFLAMGGTAGVDAGAPTAASGTYVTGGDSSGYVSSFTPQMGGGLDWRIGLFDEVNHVIQFHILVAIPGVSDADHMNLKGSYRAHFPLEDYENTLFAGIDLQQSSTELEDDNDTAEATMTSMALVFGMTY